MRAFAKLNHQQSGAVLLEVILALVLFVAAAAIIGSALNSSANGVERMRRGAHAANLATSILSELQIGSRTAGDGSPEPLAPPFDNWMWQVHTRPVEANRESGLGAAAEKPSGLVQVEVVVRDTESDFVYRLSQIMLLEAIQNSGTQPASVASTGQAEIAPW